MRKAILFITILIVGAYIFVVEYLPDGVAYFNRRFL
jgi:hypothetical protein